MHVTFVTQSQYSNRSISTSHRIQPDGWHVIVLERSHGLGRWFRFFRGKIVRGGPKISVACSDTAVNKETLCAAITAPVGHLLWVRESLGSLFCTTLHLVESKLQYVKLVIMCCRFFPQIKETLCVFSIDCHCWSHGFYRYIRSKNVPFCRVVNRLKVFVGRFIVDENECGGFILDS